LVLWVLFLALPLLGIPSVPAATPQVTATAASGVAVPTPPPFDRSNGIRFLLLLAAVCSAGAFGAMVQSMRGIRAGAVITSQKVLIDAVLGIAAGFLTAALYMLAQIAITGRIGYEQC
jgi:hypothetical protein